jgi:hypothetical protein
MTRAAGTVASVGTPEEGSIAHARAARRATALLVLAIAAGCVAPARSYDAFESKATESAWASVSDARTAILAAGLAVRGRTFAPLTAVQLAEAAAGAATTAETFASIQPPDAASDRLRAELMPLLRRAADLIAEMRIAARRDDASAIGRLRAPLAPVADALERFAEDHG